MKLIDRYLNGHRIGEAVELADGDEIAVGPARLTFRALVPPETEDDPWWRLWRQLTRQPEDAQT